MSEEKYYPLIIAGEGFFSRPMYSNLYDTTYKVPVEQDQELFIKTNNEFISIGTFENMREDKNHIISENNHDLGDINDQTSIYRTGMFALLTDKLKEWISNGRITEGPPTVRGGGRRRRRRTKRVSKRRRSARRRRTSRR